MVFLCHADNLEIKVLISMKNPLSYQIIDKKPLIAEIAPKTLKKIRQNMNVRVLANRT